MPAILSFFFFGAGISLTFVFLGYDGLLGVYVGPCLVIIACLLPDSTWKTKDVAFLALPSLKRRKQSDDNDPLANEEMQTQKNNKPIVFSQDDFHEMAKLEDPAKFAKKSRSALFKTPATRTSSDLDTSTSSRSDKDSVSSVKAAEKTAQKKKEEISSPQSLSDSQNSITSSNEDSDSKNTSK